MKIKEGTEEKVLRIYANIIFYVGIVYSVIAFIIGMIYTVKIAEELDMTIIILVGLLASLIIAALVFVPFLIIWAFIIVYAKMSSNIVSTNENVKKICNIAEILKKESIVQTPIQNKSTPSTKRQDYVNKNTSQQDIMSDAETAILDELAKKGVSQAEKLCELMEMKDDGIISQETYEKLSSKI